MTTNEQDRAGQAFDKWWLEVGIHEMPRGDEPPAHAAIARLAWNAAPAAGVNVEPSALREPRDFKGQLFNLLTRSVAKQHIFSKRMEATELLIKAYEEWETGVLAAQAEQPKSASGGQP